MRLTDAEFQVVHVLRCIGAASTERVVAVAGPSISADAERTLLELAARRVVIRDRGEFGGWRLSPAGRDADARWVAAELDRTDARTTVHAAYDDFLELNQRTLDVCSAWQVRSFDPLILNDHRDTAYDVGVLRQLAAIDAQAQPLCTRLAGSLGRFAQYGPRLVSALDRAGRGELDQVTDSVDSYHSVWFQLHEDLLATLGIDRSGEAP